ncbi:hypothetical protein PR202_gb17597 [Eleusine coracana subsp. coracana]|uniref:Uncharacterized protein n=1 Tax=Eleusine coracana subsp. coracana TaxID=191504 RepID=A0AAV5F3D3_ELECO|nr:hypothetical protein PR202_gb17597 [Eleusine coracana subsp. coracana]
MSLEQRVAPCAGEKKSERADGVERKEREGDVSPAMTPASSAAATVIAVVVASAGSPSEQSHRPSAPSSYAVWEKER